MAASKEQPLPETVVCGICRKDLDPAKPLKRGCDPSHLGEFYCVDCWLRALRTRTADSLLARALDRVLME